MSGKIRKFDVYASMHPSDGVEGVFIALQAAQAAEVSGEWKDLTLEHYDDDYHNSSWAIKGYRWETDKEYAKRMKDLEKAKVLADKQKEKQKVDERKLYEKLKKKYGDK